MPAPRIAILSDHNFKVRLGNLNVGTFRECNGLSMEFEVFEWAEGGNNEFVHHLPGRMRYPYLSLTGGMTQDTALQQWFWKTRQKAELKEVTIELQTQDGRTSRAWVFTDAYPVRWTGPRVAADSHGLASESLDIAHSGLRVG